MLETICVSALCLLFLSARLTICQDLSSSPTCNRNFSKTNGTIESPRNHSEYGIQVFCNYAVTVSPKGQISMKFEEVQVIYLRGTLLDYVIVFDGEDCTAPRIGVIYGNRTQTIISSGNRMTALFASNTLFGGTQFRAVFTTVTGQNRTKPVLPPEYSQILYNCGEHLSGRSGYLKFTGDNRENSLCIWKIKVSDGRRVHILFNKTKIGPSGAWLRVLNGDNCGAPVMQHMTGRLKTSYPEFSSSSNVMLLVYASPSSSETAQIEVSYWEVTEPTSTTETAALSSEMNDESASTPVNEIPVPPLPMNSMAQTEEMANNAAVSNTFSLMANSVGHAIAGVILLLLVLA